MNAAWRAVVWFHRHPSRRPYWQMVLLLPVWLLIYKPAEAFVNWCDERF